MQDMKICDANQTDKQVYKKWRKKIRTSGLQRGSCEPC